MADSKADVLVITSGHWSGDPRLNRHIRYLTSSGIKAQLVDFPGRGRIGGLFAALRTVWRQRPRVVLVPDPELFVAVSIVARAVRVRVVADIHENYPQAVASRQWIPGPLRPLVKVLAIANDFLARRMANRVVVAAPELMAGESILVANIPNPIEFEVADRWDENRIVYVGDVTEARGVSELAELAALRPDLEVVVIGNVSPDIENRYQMKNLTFMGRLSHDKAWKIAASCVAGLSLLRPLPAYRQAVATKLWEYCAIGLPPIVSDLPGQREFATEIHPDLVAGSNQELTTIVDRMRIDNEYRNRLSRAARAKVERAWANSRPDLALVEACQP